MYQRMQVLLQVHHRRYGASTWTHLASGEAFGLAAATACARTIPGTPTVTHLGPPLAEVCIAKCCGHCRGHHNGHMDPLLAPQLDGTIGLPLVEARTTQCHPQRHSEPMLGHWLKWTHKVLQPHSLHVHDVLDSVYRVHFVGSQVGYRPLEA